MSQVSNLAPLIHQALSNDQKIDLQEFKGLQAAAQEDGQVTAEENQLLMDALTKNQFTSDAVPSVIQFVSSALTPPSPPSTGSGTESSGTEKSGEAAKADKPVEAVKPEAAKEGEKAEKKEEKKSPWTKSYEVQGSFNHTSVSGGWTDQYGGEKTATKIEGSFKGEINYAEGRMAWKNRLLVEYGNTFVKGDTDTQRAVSRNNLEFTTEVAREIAQKGNWKIEIPYVSLYTKGPLDTLEGRKFRETTGAKVSYKNEEAQADYSLKVGGGIQQFNNPDTRKWENEAGVEVVLEAKQSFGVLKSPVVKALGTKEENVTFLDRLEANASVNTFTPLQNGFDMATTDVTIRTGARYYVNDNKSVWVGVGKEWQYGGQADSTWESKFTADVGFKFN